MPRTFKTTGYDNTQLHFTFATLNNVNYLRVGNISENDEDFFDSLIGDGYAGFFQDNTQQAITKIIGVYDANNGVPIESIPTLTADGAYDIRFTQARPGNDGTTANRGDNGWTPRIAVVVDGERRVQRVVDWTGGSGTKPATGQYVGTTGFVDVVADATDIRGGDGQQGIPGVSTTGIAGNNGWTPQLAIITDGERRVHQVIDWTDGTGNKPTTGQYIGLTGLVNNIADAIDIRGSIGGQGIQGIQGISGVGTQGDKGWSPSFVIESDGATREVLKLAAWLGGTGTPPDGIGKYISTTGLVDTKADAVNVRGTDGTPGIPGTDGISNIQFSSGIFTPVFRNVVYQNRNADGSGSTWHHGGVSSAHVDYEAASGRWLRWGNEILFFICFRAQIGSALPNGVKKIEFYFELPQGTVATAVIHGVGSVLDADDDWFGVYPRSGDNRQRVQANGDRYIEGGVSEEYNAIRIELETPPNHNGQLESLISVNGVYRISP